MDDGRVALDRTVAKIQSMTCIQLSWGLGVHMCVHVYVCGCTKLWDDGWMMNFAFWDDILNKSMAQDWDDRGMTLKTVKKEAQKP